MRCVRRSRMTGSDKTEIWQRWKQGQSLSEIGRAIDRVPGAVFHVVRARGGVAPPPRCVRPRPSRAVSARRSRAGWRRAYHSGRSACGSVVQRRPSAEKWVGTVVGGGIALRSPTRAPGSSHCVLSPVDLHDIQRCARKSATSSRLIGLRSRSRAGSSGRIRRIATCRSRTRRFT